MTENETAINLLTEAVQYMNANPNIYYNEGSVPKYKEVLWCSNLSDKICSDIFMKKNDAVVSYLESSTPVFQKLIESFNEALG